ncbi:MAG: protein kinase [bacterium]|nr:protein kinase [bacterium]
MNTEATAAALFDFFAEYLDDEASAGVRPLTEYLAHYPGHEESVAAEYLRLRAEDAGTGDAPELEPGERQVGHYRLLQELGSGGQGSVHLAEDTRIERKVAIKLLIGAFVTDEARRRFRREAESIARLEHPGICHVLEADVESDTPYIAMQHVEGLDLGASLAAASVPEGAKAIEPLLPWIPRTRGDLFRVLHFFERIGRALHAAHEAGVVHRDIKPGNIIVQPDGRPVILDFGLALAEEGGEEITRSGEIFGTPAYMSPEQLRGVREELDRRTDIYSLNVALFEALVGARPFAGENRLELERAILFDPVPDPRALNPALTEDVKVVLESGLEKERDRRYASALAFAEDLRRIREYEPIHARPASTSLKLRRWARRQPALATALVGTLLALTSGLTIALVLLTKVQKNFDLAQSRYLSVRAQELASENPAVALMLGLEAVRLAPSYRSHSSLFGPLAACSLEHVLRLAKPAHFRDLAFSPDGALVAGAMIDNRAREASGDAQTASDGALGVWDTVTGESLFSVTYASDVLRSLAFDPQGRQVAYGSESGRLRILELETREVVHDVDLAEEALVAIAYAPASDALVAAQSASGISLFDLGRGEVLGRLEASGASRLAFSPDGRKLLTGGTKGRGARIWDVATRTPLVELWHVSPVMWAEFDATGARAVTASRDGTVHVWDAATGDPIGDPHVHTGTATCATFSPDGTRLVTTTQDGDASGAWAIELATRERTPLGEYDKIVAHAAFSPDGTRVVTSSFDTVVRMFDVATGRLLTEHRELVRPIRTMWAPDGKRLLTLSPSPWGLVWRADGFPDVYDLVGDGSAVSWGAFGLDGTRAITTTQSGRVCVWNTPPGSEAGRGAGQLLHEIDAGEPVRGGALSPDGIYALAILEGGAVLRVDLESGCLVGAPLVHASPVVRASFGLDERTVVSIDDAGRAFLWTGMDDPFAVELIGQAGPITCASFTPDGQRLATGGRVDEVVVRDAKSGAVIDQVKFEKFRANAPSGVECLAFSADGEHLAVVCLDNVLRTFEVATLEPAWPDRRLGKNHTVQFLGDSDRVLVAGLRTVGAAVRIEYLAEEDGRVRPLVNHSSALTDTDVGGAGDTIATGSVNGSVLVWDASDGSTVIQFALHGGAVTAVDLIGRGGAARVLSTAEDGSAWVWPVDPLAVARARRPRDLETWERNRELEVSEDR